MQEKKKKLDPAPHPDAHQNLNQLFPEPNRILPPSFVEICHIVLVVVF